MADQREGFVRALFEHHGTALRRFLTSRFRDEADVEDIAQEAWIHARYDAITRQNRDVVSVVPGGEADGQTKLECVACGTKKTPLWRNIESSAYCVSP